MTTVLRPYQVAAVTEARQHAASGGSGCIIHAPTGAGKTAIFCDVLKGAYAKGKSAIMVVRGRSLVHQASDRLTREGVPHGIYQGAKSKDTDQRILACSVDTLFMRKEVPPADLVVIDECHLSLSDGYKWLLGNYPRAFRIGVSATPHHKEGMRHIGDRIIRPATFTDLVAQGYLVGGRYFVPYVPNLRGVKKSAGDFNVKDLAKKAEEDKDLTANAARVWHENLRGVPTLGYAVSLGHAEILAAELERSGARVAVVSARHKESERRDYFRDLENGFLDVLLSVGVLTTGIDLPFVRALLICRPTESYNLHVQIMGRGTRPHPGKEHFLCYDLAGNIYKHGPIEAEKIASLDGINDDHKGPRITTCKSCYAIFESALHSQCPSCGASLANATERETGTRIHGLAENAQVKEVKVNPWDLALPILVAEAQAKQRRKGWIYHTLKNKYGDEAANSLWPRIRALKKWAVRNASKT